MGYWDRTDRFGILGCCPESNWNGQHMPGICALSICILLDLKLGCWDREPLKLRYWDMCPGTWDILDTKTPPLTPLILVLAENVSALKESNK